MYRVDVSRYRTSRIYLLHYVSIARHRAIFSNPEWSEIGNSRASGGWVTIHACVNCRAFHIDGLILLTSDIWYSTIFVDPSICSIRITSVTTRKLFSDILSQMLSPSSITTVNQRLNRWYNISL